MKSTSKDFKEIASIIVEELAGYVDKSKSGKGKVLVQNHPQDIAEEMNLEKLIKSGSIDQNNIRGFLRKYLDNTQHMHHPAYIGHQVAVPHLAASLADMIHGVVNNPMAIYEMGPAASAMEKVVVNWMLDKIGWFNGDTLHENDNRKIGGGGVLTHGGSLANLTALLAARAKLDPDAWTKGINHKKNIKILVPATSHYSLARSVSIMGLGSDNIVPVQVNQNEQVLPDHLLKSLTELKASGNQVMAVVANACATGTGLYDPLDEIGDICNENDLWYHIDGAHGTGALITEEYKHLMKGVEKASSIIWDAHKMLRVPALSAAVLFREYEDMANTFRQKGSYIFFEKDQIGHDFMYYTVECTKHALGTKIFWALAAEGEKGIASYIVQQNKKTQEFYKIIQAQEDFEVPYKPESNILCFRYGNGDISDDFQLQLRNKIVEQGNFYITTTTIHDERYLRLTVMNPDTETEHISRMLDEIRLLAGK
jgi:L-2,4-diaminobutyrate decarboxylase